MIRKDEALVASIIACCREAVEAAGRPNQSLIDSLRSRRDRLTRQIDFVCLNVGDSDEDRHESAERLKSLRAERTTIAAELAVAEAMAGRPIEVPAETEVRRMLADLGQVLLSASCGPDPEDTGTLRALLEMLTGGRIDVVQAGESQVQMMGRARFRPSLATALNRLRVTGSTSDAPEALISSATTQSLRGTRDEVARSPNRGCITAIADHLGIDRHRVARLWDLLRAKGHAQAR